MLSNLNQSTAVNATSTVTTETGEVKSIMYMNSTVSANGNFIINQSIQDSQRYFENSETADADFAEFQGIVRKIAERTKENDGTEA